MGQNPFGGTTIEVADAAGSLVGELIRQAATELERGNVSQAEHYLEQGLARDPDDHRCQAYMAVCMAAREPRSRDAEKRAREIIDCHPDDPIGYVALGQVYLLGSRRRDAFRLFTRAHHLSTQERSLREQLLKVEPRRDPVFPNLPRNHPLNIYGGRLRAKFSRLRRS